MTYRIAQSELDLVRGQHLAAQQYFVKADSETTVKTLK